MPALMVLRRISSADGFSRKRQDVALGVGLDEPVGGGILDRRQDDASPWRVRSRWSAMRAGRSTYVNTSPLKTTTGSLWSSPAANLIAPPVPSGFGSTT